MATNPYIAHKPLARSDSTVRNRSTPAKHFSQTLRPKLLAISNFFPYQGKSQRTTVTPSNTMSPIKTCETEEKKNGGISGSPVKGQGTCRSLINRRKSMSPPKPETNGKNRITGEISEKQSSPKQGCTKEINFQSDNNESGDLKQLNLNGTEALNSSAIAHGISGGKIGDEPLHNEGKGTSGNTRGRRLSKANGVINITSERKTGPIRSGKGNPSGIKTETNRRRNSLQNTKIVTGKRPMNSATKSRRIAGSGKNSVSPISVSAEDSNSPTGCKSSASMLSSTSSCSQKSLAEIILEMRSTNGYLIEANGYCNGTTCTTILSISEETGEKSPCEKPKTYGDNNRPLQDGVIASVGKSHAVQENCNGLKNEPHGVETPTEKKHGPDVCPKEGENTRPIVRRKQKRKVVQC